MKRHWTGYLTTLANTNEQIADFATNDDYRLRHVKSIFAGITTAGVQISLYTQGQEYATVDCTRFAAGDPIVPIEFDVQPKLLIRVGVKDLAGASHANIPVVVEYEVDTNP